MIIIGGTGEWGRRSAGGVLVESACGLGLRPGLFGVRQPGSAYIPVERIRRYKLLSNGLAEFGTPTNAQTVKTVKAVKTVKTVKNRLSRTRHA
jgi:hypothetical protein